MSMTLARSAVRAGRLSAAAQRGFAGAAVGRVGRRLATRRGRVFGLLLVGVVSALELVVASWSLLAGVGGAAVTGGSAVRHAPEGQGEGVS